MEDLIPNNNKFAIYALSNFSTDSSISAIHCLNENLKILNQLPFQLDENWKKWLGKIESEQIEKSNFVILAKMKSENPDNLDEETRRLEKVVSQFFSMLFLKGTPTYDKGHIISGAKFDDTFSIRSQSKPYRFLKNSDALPERVSKDYINTTYKAFEIFVNLSNQKLRFKKGLLCRWRGLLDYSQEERLHQFVRAIEALLKTTPGKGKKDFKHRAQVFIGRTQTDRNFLEQLYDIRSYVEHHIDLNLLFPQSTCTELGKIIDRRSLQAEALSAYIYSKIFSSKDLFSIFSNEDEIDKFWEKPDHDKDAIWGSKLNLSLSSGKIKI